MNRVMRKPVFSLSDQVRHKPGCKSTEDGWRLEILDLEGKGIVSHTSVLSDFESKV